MERIITIGREYGSGGREIGRRLAEKLQFAFFDHQIVTELAKRTAFAEEYILSIQEKRPYPVLPVPTVRWAPPSPTLDQQLEVFLKESEVIRDMADKAPCVIVGRCADYVLRHRNPFRLFFYADIADRMERCRERNEEQKSMNHDALRRIITQTDKSRSRYYEFLSGQKWGAKENYDLCINTSSADTEKLLQCVISLL